MKIETETYAAHLIFIQLPRITWNDQEFKIFLSKINRVDTNFAANNKHL